MEAEAEAEGRYTDLETFRVGQDTGMKQIYYMATKYRELSQLL